jgi:hypothetical protein
MNSTLKQNGNEALRKPKASKARECAEMVKFEIMRRNLTGKVWQSHWTWARHTPT